MKTCCVSILVVLFLAIGLADAQSLPGNSTSAGDSSIARELVKPVGNKASKSTQPAGAPELTLPFAMFEPPKRFLWGDIDNDGLKDLFVLDFRGNILFRNLGNGGFEDVTKAAFPDGAGAGVTGFWGDYDGDTLTDLFLFHGEGFTLFKNDGKLRFSDVTESLGMDKGLPVSNAQLEDFDGDGFGDLILETPEGDRIFRNREGRAFGEVDLPEPDRGRAGTFTTGWPPKTPNKRLGPMGGYSAPGSGPTGPDTMLGLDGRYVNDNSPGSVGVGIPEVEGGDDLSVLNDIVDGTIVGKDIGVPLDMSGNPTTGSVFKSIHTGGTATSPLAIHGESPQVKGSTGIYGTGDYGVSGKSEGGRGVMGYTTNTTGVNYGVYGRSPADEGYGVYGLANAASGLNVGVTGKSSSTEGTGVWGHVTAASGENWGVYGNTSSPDGYGVYGEGPKKGVYGKATAASDWCWGVYGLIEGDTGHGVAGYASSPTGNVFGVSGRSYSDIGKGVYGYASSATGENFGVLGQTNSTTGYGVWGEAKASSGANYGVYGITHSEQGIGVYGESPDVAVKGYSSGAGGVAVHGVNYQTSGKTIGVQGTVKAPEGRAVAGISIATSGETKGVFGQALSSDSGYGVYGVARKYGVYGESTNNSGTAMGVHGKTDSTAGWAVYGVAEATSGFSRGVYGQNYSTSGYGVYGWASASTGTTYGMYGKAASPDGYGGYFVGGLYGVFGYATTKEGYGGYFLGGTSTDTLTIRGGSDLSEQFDIRAAEAGIEPAPGMVVCIDPNRAGELIVSSKAFDRTVAGIISGAGGIQTGMLMGQEGSKAHGETAVALTGRVYCLADASGAPIKPGDLLTTSDIPGHAMKVTEFDQADGALIGKAMTSLESGRGLVLVLVSLH